MTRNLFEGKNVLVVGGNSGIGLAAAKAFSQEGANLIITGRNVETLTSKADEIGGRTSAYQCDVTDMEQIKDLVVKVELEFGYIDVLFISAGQYSSGSINSVTEENWDWLMDTNLKGMFFTIQGMLPLMGNPSSIVLMGSIAGRLAVAESPVYAASKAGVRSLARSLAADFVTKGAVSLNWLVCTDTSKEVKAGDKISMRGKGKAEVVGISGKSRKGRLFVDVKKYI